MDEFIKTGIKITWFVVILFWTVSGLQAKKVQSQEGMLARFIQYWLPLLVAILLLGPGKWFGHSWLRENFVQHTNLVGLIGLTVAIIGAIIACYSRYLLGKNWSLSIQEKNDHELIQTGIYRQIRHPIYTGLLLLFTGNAIIVGDYRAILAFIIVFFSFWFKLNKEEKLLVKLFGERYRLYQQHSKKLIPYVL